MRGLNFRVNEQLSVGPGEYRDISARTQKNGDIAAKRLHRDLCGGGFP